MNFRIFKTTRYLMFIILLGKKRFLVADTNKFKQSRFLNETNKLALSDFR